MSTTSSCSSLSRHSTSSSTYSIPSLSDSSLSEHRSSLSRRSVQLNDYYHREPQDTIHRSGSSGLKRRVQSNFEYVDPEAYMSSAVACTSGKQTLHFVVATLATDSKRDSLDLLFGIDHNTEERTISWTVDGQSALVTLAQLPDATKENLHKNENHLDSLVQRGGITTFLLLLPSMDDFEPLLDHVTELLGEFDTGFSCWPRFILAINDVKFSSQQVKKEREAIMRYQVPELCHRFQCPVTPSVLFASTKLYKWLRRYKTTQAQQYRNHCRRLLWRIMDHHQRANQWRGNRNQPDVEDEPDNLDILAGIVG
ncbi:uncharacterized protein BYT42DRAFT_618290 [Radiomyces spectabilis]|uniref:uncharacterized protein n=1 Tax=Radiomyces spectabilis TaxID=64574 RepID=UPI0022205DA5|nr:uncharacterized protein BYT42DRAFT_618290 [Radiomyces spectabilis]KAI8366784.1 hypothetical protein BYT42DRAFT_618290 [Radiomyces spectabilis]